MLLIVTLPCLEVQARTEAAIKTAEKNAKDAWNAALKTGWTKTTELAKIGLPEPRTDKRKATRTTKNTDENTGATPDNINTNTDSPTESQS